MIVAADTKLDFPLQDGTTKRKHLISIAKQTGELPEELIVPKVPAAGRYIKSIYDQIALNREWENGYPKSIASAEIYYWCKLREIKLSQHHLLVVQKLDVTQINSFVDCIKERG